MCGIIGYAGKDIESFNPAKFNILGVFNEIRGRHSCGVTSDGEIYIGVSANKEFTDFIINKGYDLPEKYPTVIGHTRWATGGAHTIVNAHPFGFGKNLKEDGFEFVGVHNGTLVNHGELAKEYAVNPSSQSGIITRHKIDSEILLEIIHRRGFEVLSKYNGAACVVFTNTLHPNVIYVFRGESNTIKNGRIKTEERPLFYLRENANSLYLSSLKNSLEFIREDPEMEIEEFEPNFLYTITNGDIDNAEMTYIDRTERYQKESYSASRSAYNSYSGWPNHGGHHAAFDNDGYAGCSVDTRKKNKHKNGKHKHQHSSVKNLYPKKEDNLLFNILDEKPKEEETKGGQLYYSKLRYWQNDKLASGIYTMLRNGVYYYLGHTIPNAKRTFNNLAAGNKYGDDGDESSFIYFYKGILMKEQNDYSICASAEIEFSTMQLSHVSRYPIVDLGIRTPLAFLDGKVANEKYLPIAGSIIYNLKGGRLESYITKHDDPKVIAANFILEVDKEFYDVTSQEADDGKIKDTELKVVEQYKDEILSTIEECAGDSGEDLTNDDLKTTVQDLLTKIKEFTKEKFEVCLKKVKV